jgi:hypothetical protein
VLTDGYPYVEGTFSRDVNTLPVFSMPEGKVNVILLEINPNNQDINRFNEIKHEWYRWLKKIGVNRVYAVKYSATDDEKKRAIERFVNSQLTDSITEFKITVAPPVRTNPPIVKPETKTVSTVPAGPAPEPTRPVSKVNFEGYFSIQDDERKIVYFLTRILSNEAARTSSGFRDVFTDAASLFISRSPDHKSPGSIYSLACSNKPALISLGRENLSGDRYQNLVKCLQKCP